MLSSLASFWLSAIEEWTIAADLDLNYLLGFAALGRIQKPMTNYEKRDQPCAAGEAGRRGARSSASVAAGIANTVIGIGGCAFGAYRNEEDRDDGS